MEWRLWQIGLIHKLFYFETNSSYRDKILQRKPNTDGWGNKLVTIFARHLDNFILKPNLSLIYLIRDFGSGQIRATETNSSFAGICKNCAMAACPPGQILPKAPRHVNGRADAANVYSLNRRAVRLSKNLPVLLITNNVPYICFACFCVS
jgi:hypothetical protein